MSLEERTLVVRNLDGVSRDLLVELFNQAGPVVNVVLRTDFAYIEFEHKVSVGYSLALFEGIYMFGRPLHLEPKVRNDSSNYHFVGALNQFNHVMHYNPDFFRQFAREDSHRDTERRRDVDHRRSGGRDERRKRF
ncbi:RNA-binding protein 7-like [Oppia nitens]|uniref:RNA-binding protein 7-like n=1 Tax=Oppia nitens TaxID=1686743 RepID=UPI0023DC3272|nr:RNA-binding protein 7-like [Oppia nitens]